MFKEQTYHKELGYHVYPSLRSIHGVYHHEVTNKADTLTLNLSTKSRHVKKLYSKPCAIRYCTGLLYCKAYAGRMLLK